MVNVGRKTVGSVEIRYVNRKTLVVCRYDEYFLFELAIYDPRFTTSDTSIDADKRALQVA